MGFDALGRRLYEPPRRLWGEFSGQLHPRTASIMTQVVYGEITDPSRLERRIQSIIAEIRSAAQPNWLSCASILSMLVCTGGDDVDFTHRYGGEARVQFLIAVLSDLPFDTDAGVDEGDYENLAALTAEAFELARGLVFLRAPDREDFAQVTSRHLQMEALEDRFEMYGRHVGILKAHLLDPFSEEFERILGWSFDDYWRVAEASAIDSNAKRESLSLRFEEQLDSVDNSGRDKIEHDLHHAMANVGFHSASDLSRVSGVELSRVEALLESMTLPTDGSAVVKSPVDAAPLRTTGVVRLPDGRYFVPLPHLWRQDIFRVLDTVLTGKLRERWHKLRDDGVEGIVSSRLTMIFGEENVWQNVGHLGGPEDGETDILVDLGDDALFVECKAHSLTPAGRRGAPDRVGKKTIEIVEKSQQQIDKGRNHLVRGGSFKPKRGPAISISPGATPLLPGLAVSFERIDPVFMNSALRESHTEKALVISLADFLALSDLVTEPSSFLYYVRERSKLLSRSQLSAATELDYVGMFLEHQTLSDIPGADQRDFEILVDGYGPSLNRFLAVAEDQFAPPDMRYPPKSILAALSESARTGSRGWTRAAEISHRTTFRQWAAFRRMMRKSTRGKPFRRDWVLPGGDMRIQFDTTRSASYIIDSSPVVLVMGTAAAALEEHSK